MCNVCRIGVCFQERIRKHARGSDERDRFPRFGIQRQNAIATFDDGYRLCCDGLRDGQVLRVSQVARYRLWLKQSEIIFRLQNAPHRCLKTSS